MKKHEKTFTDVVLARCDLAGIREIKTLSQKTGLSTDIISAHLKDGRWSREQMHELHRFLHFEVEDMEIFLDGKLSGRTDDSVARLVSALVPALERYAVAEGK